MRGHGRAVRTDPTVTSTGPAPAPGARAGQGGPRHGTGAARARRPEPRRLPEHAHLSLEGLRSYRHLLREEESRISYWRRVLQSRLDLLVATGADHHDTGRLASMFRGPGGQSARSALLQAVPEHDVPPLPDLAPLWSTEVDSSDVEACRALVRELTAAEHVLTVYRSAVVTRLERATTELIARYRENPRQCLDLLPSPPEGEPAALPTR